jgi:hypothetical protein
MKQDRKTRSKLGATGLSVAACACGIVLAFLSIPRGGEKFIYAALLELLIYRNAKVSCAVSDVACRYGQWFENNLDEILSFQARQLQDNGCVPSHPLLKLFRHPDGSVSEKQDSIVLKTNPLGINRFLNALHARCHR